MWQPLHQCGVISKLSVSALCALIQINGLLKNTEAYASLNVFTGVLCIPQASFLLGVCTKPSLVRKKVAK